MLNSKMEAKIVLKMELKIARQVKKKNLTPKTELV